MSMGTQAGHQPRAALQPVTIGWVLKRSAIGIAILTVAISCLAWLTYASIDPHLDAQRSIDAPASTVTKVNLSL